jgi:hypothetical protein
MSNSRIVTVSFLAVYLSALALFLSDIEAARCNAQTMNDPRQLFLSETPDSPGSIILGRPTDRSIILSILLREVARVVIRYGDSDKLDKQFGPVEVKAGEPQEVLIENLQPDTMYLYRVVDAETQKSLMPVANNGHFHTQRASGKAFTFTVQADSHLDGGCSLLLYELTLKNASNAEPDFHIDLGDTFMTGKIVDRTLAVKQYEAQRYWLGQIGKSVPLFLVIGNHDGEEVFRKSTSEAHGLAAWACLQRKRYFPNPFPDNFYSGNTQSHKSTGILQDYYAWEWGDALFVVLDPYWFSEFTRGGSQPWNMTLGKTQYDWLAKTLRSSKAKFKFVFIHQMISGLDNNGRGGLEVATLFEWGGHEKNDEYTFAANRSGWEKPIHSLLVETGVTIVFHGHDHFFARQELDGVIYQLVPQPAHKNFRNHHAKEYGYEKGVFLPNSGHLRVQVNSEQVMVDYIRTADQDMRDRGIVDGQNAFSYRCDLQFEAKR